MNLDERDAVAAQFGIANATSISADSSASAVTRMFTESLPMSAGE